MTQLSPAALEGAAKALYREFENRPLYAQTQMNGVIANECATAAITAYLAQREKEGFVEVPKEPTVAMRSAVAKFDWESKCDVDWADGYRVMLTAASQEQNDASN